MPELPEVETVRRGLQRRLPGKRIVRVQVHRTESVATPGPRQFALQLQGKEFVAVRRRGKYLLFDLAPAGLLVVHLRMSGRLLLLSTSSETDHDRPQAIRTKKTVSRSGSEISHTEFSLVQGAYGENSNVGAGKALAGIASRKKRAQPLTPYERIRFELDEDLLVFDDMRVFGRAWYLPGDASEQQISGIAELGPEPLEGLCAQYLLDRFARKTQAIKTALLDQTIIAGIGNIYADEILHLSGVNPLRAARSLSRKEIERMVVQIVSVLQQAITAGGSSIRDYTDSDGVNGNYQTEAYVYGRKGAPCRQCQSLIERIKLGGRSSHFCPRCQPAKKTRKADSG